MLTNLAVQEKLNLKAALVNVKKRKFMYMQNLSKSY